MYILGIETSCDETSAAVVEDGRIVRSCVIASSQQDFVRSGGVIPERAARRQLECILPVIRQCLHSAQIRKEDIGCIAVTQGPGLLGSLLVGTTTARVLAATLQIPIIAVHHTLGHLFSTWLTNGTPNFSPAFPLLTLSVSGGHTDMWYRTGELEGMLVGSTRDDAVGEAFDKGATLLGLPYPGGPSLANLARRGNAHAYHFPLPFAHDDQTLDFSFSGLKTSLKYLLRDLCLEHSLSPDSLPEQMRADIAASYELALCAHLLMRVRHYFDRTPSLREVHIVGGVSANETLRHMMSSLCKEYALQLRMPTLPLYCTDNAAMIASAGYYLHQSHPLGTSNFRTASTLALTLSTHYFNSA